MRRSSPRFVVLLVAGLVIGACSAQPGTSAPSATPAAADATDLCAIAANSSVELAAGDYLVTATQPAMTVTLPAGFFAACADGAFNLSGPAGGINVIAPVASVQLAAIQQPVSPTIDAVQTAVIGGAVEATDPEPVEIAGAQGVEFVITVNENGVGLRSAAGRGWAFANDEFETGGFTLLDAGATIVGIIRHGDDPLEVYDDVLATLQFVPD
jgi:hypothetical protein